MRILGVGAGPANLYYSILLKKAYPQADIRLVERNPADATVGWGVVFSDETLGNFDVADHVNTIVAAGPADLCAMARPHLINPHLTMEAAGCCFANEQPWPRPYLAARPQREDEPESFLGRLGRDAPRIRRARRHGD